MSEASDDSRITVLVVDDDRAFCQAMAGSLRRRGFAVVVAHSYEDALAEAEAWSPDRAVVDLRMPGRGGLELVRELLAIDPATRIVVLTGYGSIATAIEAIRIGAVHYLQKPADADQILVAFDPDNNTATTNEGADVPSLARVEWEHIQRVMHDCDGNVSQAARLLGIHRRSLQRKLGKNPVRR